MHRLGKICNVPIHWRAEGAGGGELISIPKYSTCAFSQDSFLIQINTFFLFKTKHPAATPVTVSKGKTHRYKLNQRLTSACESKPGPSLCLTSKQYQWVIQIMWPTQFKASTIPVLTNLHFPFCVNANFVKFKF